METKRGAQPGNKNAVKNKPFEDALRRVLAQSDRDVLFEVAQRLADIAMHGDPTTAEWRFSVEQLLNRTDGKPAQQVTVQNPDGSPVFTSIEINLKRARQHDDA